MSILQSIDDNILRIKTAKDDIEKLIETKEIEIPDKTLINKFLPYLEQALNASEWEKYFLNAMIGSGDVKFPYGITKIFPNQFKSAETNIIGEVPDTLTSIGQGAFTESSITEFICYSPSVITPTIYNETAVSTGLFQSCKYLKRFIVPNIKTLGSYCFRSCTNLEELDITNCESIGGQLLAYNSKITEIKLGSNIQTISSSAFTYSKVKRVEINRAEDSVSGSPWGGSGITVVWTGDS